MKWGLALRNRLSGGELIKQVCSTTSSKDVQQDERGSVQFGPDAVTARDLAEAAGRLLLNLRTTMPPGSELRDAGDQTSHRFLVDELSRRRPADRVLSEEGAHQKNPASPTRRGRVWVVDPLDGTREFSEPPRDDWAVHVALVIDGHPVAGAVALPGRGMVMSSAGPLPKPFVPASSQRPRLLVSRTRPAAHAAAIAKRMDAELVSLGSAGAKAMAVVLGEADIYVHSGGQYEWDSAAPVAVALAAGFHATRLDGSPLVYDRPDPWLPDLLICRPDLAENVITICRELA